MIIVAMCACFTACGENVKEDNKIEVETVTLDKNSLEIDVGETYTFSANIYPINASDKTLTWTSANTDIATVDNGILKAISKGTTTVIVTTANGKISICNVSVNDDEPINSVVKVESVILDKTSLELKVGETCTLNAIIDPSESTDKTLTWTSSNNDVATVDNGTVKAVSKGLASIIVQTENNKLATCTVHVTDLYDDFVFDLKENNTYSVLRYIGKETEVVIPSSYNGKVIDTIDKKAFYKCTDIVNVVMSDDIIEIGDSAFRDCSKLISVSLSDNINNIGQDAFYGCKSLKEIILPDGIKEIKRGTFCGCNNLANVKIPDNVVSIERDVFNGCRKLSAVTLPNELTSIGESAFNSCISLEYIIIPDTVNYMGIYAFYGCSGLINITISDNLTYIGERTFYDCNSLIDITLPDKVSSIGKYAFFGCDSLTDISIGSGVISIGEFAFSDCTKLTNVTFENLNGWKYYNDSTLKDGADISSESLSDPVTAANYLKDTYSEYYWECNKIMNVYVFEAE